MCGISPTISKELLLQAMPKPYCVVDRFVFPHISLPESMCSSMTHTIRPGVQPGAWDVLQNAPGLSYSFPLKIAITWHHPFSNKNHTLNLNCWLHWLVFPAIPGWIWISQDARYWQFCHCLLIVGGSCLHVIQIHHQSDEYSVHQYLSTFVTQMDTTNSYHQHPRIDTILAIIRIDMH